MAVGLHRAAGIPLGFRRSLVELGQPLAAAPALGAVVDLLALVESERGGSVTSVMASTAFSASPRADIVHPAKSSELGIPDNSGNSRAAPRSSRPSSWVAFHFRSSEVSGRARIGR